MGVNWGSARTSAFSTELWGSGTAPSDIHTARVTIHRPDEEGHEGMNKNDRATRKNISTETWEQKEVDKENKHEQYVATCELRHEGMKKNDRATWKNIFTETWEKERVNKEKAAGITHPTQPTKLLSTSASHLP